MSEPPTADAPRIAPSDEVLDSAVARLDVLGCFQHVPADELAPARRELWCMLASRWHGGSYSVEGDGIEAGS